MVEVAVSVLTSKNEDIIKEIYDLETAKIDYFHIDVMDGKFVENNTIDKMVKYTEYIKQISNIPIDVHLMVKDIEENVKEYLNLDVSCISFQIEATKNEKHAYELIKMIKENNTKVGIAVSPKTDIEKIYEYLPYLHKVIIMTVEPGQGGQQLIPEMVEKIAALNKFAYENGYDIDIEVDGGINGITAKNVIDAGANILVSGSYVLNMNNYNEAIRILKQK